MQPGSRYLIWAGREGLHGREHGVLSIDAAMIETKGLAVQKGQFVRA